MKQIYIFLSTSLILDVHFILRLQGSLLGTRSSIQDTYGHENATAAGDKEVLVRMEDVFEKKEMESWEGNNKMRDQTLQKLRQQEEKEREEVERLFIELKRQEQEEALQKEREEAARMEYELRMQEEENRIEKASLRDELARKTAVLELRKKEIEKEEQEIAELQRLEQDVITKKNAKIEAIRLAELHEVEEVARLAAKKKQDEADVAARIKREEEEEEQERLEDEKRIADWKILEAKRNEEEIIGEVVKAKELVRRQSMVISDEVEMMTALKPPEAAAKDPDSNDDNENDEDKWTDFMSIEEWDGDSAPPVMVEGGALDSLISGRVPCPAKVGRAKKRAADKKTPGWANDLTVSETPARKDSAESVDIPILPSEPVKADEVVQSKAKDETTAAADPETAAPVKLKEYLSEVPVAESVIVKETEVEVLVPTAISQPMVAKEKEEEKGEDEKKEEEEESGEEKKDVEEKEEEEEGKVEEIKVPRAALDLSVPDTDEETVPSKEVKPVESSVPVSLFPTANSERKDEDKPIENSRSVLDMPLDVEQLAQYEYPPNENDSQRDDMKGETMADLHTEGKTKGLGINTDLSMMRSFMESISPSKRNAKERAERDMQRRKSEKEEEEGPSDVKESKKAERRPSKIGKEIEKMKLTKSQKAARAIEKQRRVRHILIVLLHPSSLYCSYPNSDLTLFPCFTIFRRRRMLRSIRKGIESIER